MGININDITITSLETITAFQPVTGNYRFTLDELQNAKIAQTQDKTDIVGKQGRKLSSLKKNKAVVVSGTNGLISAGMMETQTGSSFETKETTVLWTDYITAGKDAATISFKAVGTIGNEIESVYVKNSDQTLGKAFTQAATVAPGKFTYTPATKALAFETGEIAEDAELVVFYMRKITASVLENLSDKYSEKLTLYVDAFGEDKCGNVYRIQFYIPKADVSGNFDIDIGDNQTVHAFEAEALAGACGASAAYYTYTVFGVDTEDVA